MESGVRHFSTNDTKREKIFKAPLITPTRIRQRPLFVFFFPLAYNNCDCSKGQRTLVWLVSTCPHPHFNITSQLCIYNYFDLLAVDHRSHFQNHCFMTQTKYEKKKRKRRPTTQSGVQTQPVTQSRWAWGRVLERTAGAVTSHTIRAWNNQMFMITDEEKTNVALSRGRI